MKVYNVPFEVPTTNITNAYIIADSNIADGSYHQFNIPGHYGFDTADDVLQAFDNVLSSSAWRRAPQVRYNRSNTQYQLEFEYPLLETYWSGDTSFQALETIYADDTTFAQIIKVDGTIVDSDSKAFIYSATTGGSTIIGQGSPFSYHIVGNGGNIAFIFNIIPEEAISSGYFNFSTDQYVAALRFEIDTTPAAGWVLRAYTAGYNTHIPQQWIDDYNGKSVGDPDDDPYSGDDGTDDESGPGGGGDGSDQDNYDPDSDPNPVPGLPTISAVDTGFITLYNPTAYELRSLATYMWSGLFDLNTYKKIMADPMDAILGLSIVPVNVPSSGSSAVTIGNINTGITLNKASAQYVALDCGTVKISEKWHAYMDYSPYTKLNIFLPYIGSHELNIDEVQGTTLGVVYHVDVLSGACVAFITANGRVIYEFSGQCSVSIPITAHDFTQTIMALGQLAASGAAGAVTTIASGGLSAPVSAAMISGGITAAANTANNVAANKPRVSQSGNLSGSNGLLGIQTPYIFMERPRLCVPASQNAYTGYPSYITYTLGTLSGFTQVQDVKLNGIGCTEEERNEILSLLREGVIL